MAQQIAGIVWTVAQAETPAWTLLVALLVAAVSAGAALILAMRRRAETLTDRHIESIVTKIDGVACDVKRIERKVTDIRVEFEKRMAPLEARMNN